MILEPGPHLHGKGSDSIGALPEGLTWVWYARPFRWRCLYVQIGIDTVMVLLIALWFEDQSLAFS